jgi:ornithine cyclodeaminase/alanine dehydrogenase-like protein (mu-crystallin family)
VEQAVTPDRAVEAVRVAFVAYARGEWTMQPKVYVTNYPAGDFRAMPALGAGHALLKWVTSFPGTRRRACRRSPESCSSRTPRTVNSVRCSTRHP